GKAAILRQGQSVRVINIHGSQVVDTWAFSLRDPREFMSMEHTHTSLLRLFPKAGDALVSNRRRAILTMTEDTSPGIHDTVIAACDRYRYELLGCTGYHDSCTDNLAAGLAELGMTPPETPSPLNLFMNIPVGKAGSLSFEPTVSKPGDYVTLRAEMDCVVAFSACPQDIVPINGKGCTPMDAEFEILS
ncbi:MAG: DUF1989 domain-containing protein, partial [Alphaproteobacteria bacterium]